MLSTLHDPVRYLVEDGDHVDADTAFAEIEVMKMVMPLVVSHSGILRLSLQAGAVMAAGDVVANLLLDDPSKVKLAQPYTGTLPTFKTGTDGDKTHHVVRRALSLLSNVLHGYCVPEPLFSQRCDSIVNDELVTALNDPRLPLLELQDVLSALSSRLPPSLVADINSLLTSYAFSVNSMFCTFPTKAIAALLDAHSAAISRKPDQDDFLLKARPIYELVHEYRNGNRNHAKSVMSSLLREYLATERLFNAEVCKRSGLGTLYCFSKVLLDLHNLTSCVLTTALQERSHNNFESTMYALREQYKNESSKLVDIVRSHYNVPYKNKLALLLLKALCGKDSSQATNEDKKLFDELGMLTSKETSPVSVRARQILIQSTLPSFKRRCLDMEIFIQTAVENIGDTAANSLQQLVDEGGAVFDVLTHMFSHKNEQIQRAGVCV